MIGVQNDVSDRMDAVEDRHLLHSVIHDNEDAMLIAATGADGGPGVVTHVNRAFVALTGLDREAAVGRMSAEVLPRVLGEEAYGRVSRKMQANERHADDVEIAPGGGCRVWVRYLVSPVRSRGRRVAQWCHVLRDISEQRRLEQEVVDVVRHEQLRLARDLHDRVAQDLAAAALTCSMVRDRLEDAEAKADLIGVYEDIRQAARQARSIAHGLMPHDVAERGLAAALAKLADQTTEHHEVVCVFLGGEVGVEPGNANHLYYIAREAVSNAVRHGRAGRVAISLEASDGTGTLTVSDDGAGLSEGGTSKGIGIRTMHSRARLIGGQLQIGHGLDGGVAVRCTFPASGGHRDAG